MIIRFLLLLGANLLLTGNLKAEATGENVTYRGRPMVGNFFANSQDAKKATYQTPISDPSREPFDTVLFQGNSLQKEFSVEIAIIENRQEVPIWHETKLKIYSNGRFWGKLTLENPTRGAIQLRTTVSTDQYREEITFYTIETLLDSAERETKEPRPAHKPTIAELKPQPKPTILERSTWKALVPREPYEQNVPYRFTQHHTSGKRTFKLEDSIIEMQLIQEFHQEGRGWSDIGYHFVIDGEGRIFEGRPSDVIGAHVKDENPGNIGIALMGSYQAPFNDRVTPKQLESMMTLYLWLASNYKIDPETLKGHRDYKNTDCPGDLVYPLLPKIKQKLRENLSEQKSTKAFLDRGGGFRRWRRKKSS